MIHYLSNHIPVTLWEHTSRYASLYDNDSGLDEMHKIISEPCIITLTASSPLPQPRMAHEKECGRQTWVIHMVVELGCRKVRCRYPLYEVG